MRQERRGASLDALTVPPDVPVDDKGRWQGTLANLVFDVSRWYDGGGENTMSVASGRTASATIRPEETLIVPRSSLASRSVSTRSSETNRLITFAHTNNNAYISPGRE